MAYTWLLVHVTTSAAQHQDDKIMKENMSVKNIKAFTVPCSAHWNQCEKNETCIRCFDPFLPAFSMHSFEGCDEFRVSFMESCSKDCDKENKQLQKLEQCVADELFYIITLGAVTNFCSIYGTEHNHDKYGYNTL